MFGDRYKYVAVTIPKVFVLCCTVPCCKFDVGCVCVCLCLCLCLSKCTHGWASFVIGAPCFVRVYTFHVLSVSRCHFVVVFAVVIVVCLD